MPGRDDLPANTARWRPDSGRAALLIHDMQQYFLRPFPADEPPLTDLLANVTLLRDRCVQLGIPLCYTTQPGAMSDERRGLLRDFWGPGMSVQPADRDVVAPLRPQPGRDWTTPKWRYSAFHHTTLRSYLGSIGRDQLIICGVYAHIGVLMTACDAFSFDIAPFLVADAVADFTIDEHLLALEYAARRCAMVSTTQDLLETLTEVTA